MNVIQARWREHKLDAAEWEKDVKGKIISLARHIEDHPDAVERSGFAEEACDLMERAFGGEVSSALLKKLKTLVEEVDKEISGVKIRMT